MTKFLQWWLAESSVNDSMHEASREAWNKALDLAAECVVPDGNPEVALEKIKQLKEP